MMKRNRLSDLPKTLLVLSFLACLTPGCGNSSGNANSTQTGGRAEVSSEASGDSEYFEEINGAQEHQFEDGIKPLRTRQVLVKIDALREKLKRSVGSSVKLGVFSDKNFEIFVEGVEKISDKNVVVTGHITGDQDSGVTLAINDDVFLANIQPSDGLRYSVQYVGSGAHSIQEFENKGSEDDCLTEDAANDLDSQEPQTAQDVSEDTQSATALAATPVIDMLVAYTPGARYKAGGTTAMKTLIQMGIADSNKAYAASGVNLKVRLVGTMELRQNDHNDYSNDLYRLKTKGDGFWDEVHAKRVSLGADQVTVVGTYTGNGVAGIGYINALYSKAFTIVKVNSFSQYSFTHELGHNIGLNHYDGYVNYTGRFRTIMAYGSVRRILRFSSATLTYSGYRTGTTDKNSARILNANAGRVANYLAPRM